MKIFNYSLIAICFSLLFFASCSKTDVVEEGLYAPSGKVVSNSMDEFTNTIAESIGLNKEDITISSLSYLDVPKGYIAEVNIFSKKENITKKAYSISTDILPDLQFEGELQQFPTAKRISAISSITLLCGCGNSTFASSGCEPSITISDGSTTATCKKIGCSFGCVANLTM